MKLNVQTRDLVSGISLRKMITSRLLVTEGKLKWQ
jgi:hypothetical protein